MLISFYPHTSYAPDLVHIYVNNYLHITAWTVNDFLVDPLPFDAVKRVWIYLDQPKQNKLWINQDVIDSPHFWG